MLKFVARLNMFVFVLNAGIGMYTNNIAATLGWILVALMYIGVSPTFYNVVGTTIFKDFYAMRAVLISMTILALGSIISMFSLHMGTLFLGISAVISSIILL